LNNWSIAASYDTARIFAGLGFGSSTATGQSSRARAPLRHCSRELRHAGGGAHRRHPQTVMEWLHAYHAQGPDRCNKYSPITSGGDDSIDRRAYARRLNLKLLF
jgi:hypothetical protein